MNAIIIDACNAPMCVICVCGERSSVRICDGIQRLYNSAILPSIDNALIELGISIQQIDVVACVVGAGSFTGIRIGVATATALARGLGVKTIGITEFEVMAFNQEGHILTAIDAGHGNFYTAEFDNGNLIKMNNRTVEEINNFDGRVIKYATDTDEEKYIAVLHRKFIANDFNDKLVPLYLKESQAEREKAETKKIK